MKATKSFVFTFLLLGLAVYQAYAELQPLEDQGEIARKKDEGTAAKIGADPKKEKVVPFRMVAKKAALGESSSSSQQSKFKTASARRSRRRSSSRTSSSRTTSSRSRRRSSGAFFFGSSSSCSNSTGNSTCSGGGGGLGSAGFFALMSPFMCCICYKNWRARTYTHCRFCEVEVKWKVYKEHRENCFTENIDKIKGFKEAPLPKECPKDENHILYQWPDRKKNGSMFPCEEDNCDNPARIEVTKKETKTKGYGKNKKKTTTTKQVKTKNVKWSEGQHLHCLLCNYSRCMDCHQKIKLAAAADLLLAQQAEAEKAKTEAVPPPAPVPEAPSVVVNVVAPAPVQEAAPPPPPAFKPFSMTCKEEGCDFVTDTAEDEAHLPLVMKAYELHVSTAHGPPPHLEYVAPPTEDELYGGGPRPAPEEVAAAVEEPPPPPTQPPAPAPAPPAEDPPPAPAPAAPVEEPAPPAEAPAEPPATCPPEPSLPGQPD